MMFLGRFHIGFIEPSPKYVRFAEDVGDETEVFISDSKTTEKHSKSKPGLGRTLGVFTLFVVQGFVIFVLAMYMIFTRRTSTDLSCARQLSPWSPYLDTDDLEYEEFDGQNHFAQPSEYRGQPTAFIEQSWQDLFNLPPISISGDRLASLHKGPESDYVHVDPKYGGEVMGYLDIFHQLHCLNTVRQYTYRNEYDYSNVTAFRAPGQVVRAHIDHCIETVRKALMCASDVTPLVFRLDESRPERRRGDFDAPRKCRNYKKIQQWALKNHAYPSP